MTQKPLETKFHGETMMMPIIGYHCNAYTTPNWLQQANVSLNVALEC